MSTSQLRWELLYKGIGSLGPAQGGGAYFVAVIFGFSQQLFTQLIDSKANTVLGQATPRSGPVAGTGTKPSAHP